MTMQMIPGRRGLVAVRADASDATKVLADLQKAVADMRTAQDEKLKEVAKGFDDVVKTEQVDRINAEITRLTKAHDEISVALAALRVGGDGGKAPDPAHAEHAAQFDRFFRQGEVGNLRDLEVKAGLTTQSKPDGGYVVPTTMESTIDRILSVVSAVRGLASVMSISTGSYTKLVNMGGAGSGWVGEEETRTETATPVLRELEFPVMEIYAEPYATQIALDDASMSLEQWLGDEVAIKFAEQEGDAFVNGSGVKKPRGILQYPTVANASYAWGSLGFTVTGAAAAFASSNPSDALIDLYHSLKQGYRPSAAFLMSDAVLATVRKFKDGQGNYLWMPPSAAEGPGTILGKSVYTDDNMPSLGAGNFPVAFGDFKRGYLILDRIGIRVLRNPYKVHGKVAFYTTKRVGGGVQNFEAIKLLKCST